MSGNKQRLMRLYERLNDAGRDSLLDYAEFLVARQGQDRTETILAEPNPAPRPAGETVIAAIRRLRAGYPMLNTEALLNDVSALMAQHTMQGRPADEIIDDLETLFDQHYQRHSGS